MATRIEDIETLLKHLRSIHLTFVLAAVAIVIALSASDTVFERAEEQLADVARLSERLTDTYIAESILAQGGRTGRPTEESRGNLEKFLSAALSDYFELFEIFPEDFHVSHISVELPSDDAVRPVGFIDDYLEFQDRTSWLLHGPAVLLAGEVQHTSPLSLPRWRPSTLASYRRQFDELLAADAVMLRPRFDFGFLLPGSPIADRHVAPEDAVVQALDGARDVRLFLTLRSLEFTTQASRDVHATALGHLQSDPIAYESYDFDFDEMRLDVVARTGADTRVAFDLALPVMFTPEPAQFFLDLLDDPAVDPRYRSRYLSGARSFDALFPELTQSTGLVGALPLGDLERYLDEQQRLAGAPISVLGLQISRDLVEVWGVFLMLCIQLYFCMHFKALLDRLPAGLDLAFPWIALYRAPIPSLVFQFSIALPMAAALLGAVREWPPGLPDWQSGALVAIAAILLGWAEALYLSMRRKLAAPAEAAQS